MDELIRLLQFSQTCHTISSLRDLLISNGASKEQAAAKILEAFRNKTLVMHSDYQISLSRDFGSAW